MAQTYQDTNVNSLTINILNKTEYNNLSQVSPTELYLVEEQLDSVVTQGSTNPVQSGAVYNELQNHHDVIMVYFAHNKAYTVSLTDAYYDTTDEELVAQDPATWTGQTPQLPIITVGYYYDLLTGKIYYIENEGDLPVEVTDVEIQGDTNKLYIDLNTSKAYRWNGSTFMLIATGGSYNDLTDTPQNATTTTAGLMSAEDKTYSTDLQSFGTPKIFSVATYKCILLADITTFWNSSSSTVNLPLQGFVGFAIKFRDGGNIFNASADITAMVSYQNNGGSDHKILTTSNSKLTPHIVSYDNKIYITLDYGDVQNHYLKLLGTFHNCLSTPLQVNQSDCTLIE